MYRYKTLIDHNRIEIMDFEHSELLPECQLSEIAYNTAKKMGFTTFGINGVTVMRDVVSNGAG